MELNILHLLLLLTSVVHSALSQGEIKTVLRLEPSRTQIFPGDSVTLICDTEPKSEHAPWYKFYKKPEHQDQVQDLTFWIKENNYNIPTVKKSDSGSYWCKRDDIDTESDRLHVIVSGEIKTVLRLEPSRTQIFPGDSVTLICDTEPKTQPAVWYKFYKKPEHKDQDQDLTGWIKENNYNITTVEKSDSGSYWCERYGIDTEGDRLHLIVSELPVPTVTLVSPQRPFYSGDTVTLSCDITPQYTDWELYFWYRDRTCITSKTSRTISISLPDEAGQYGCSGRRAGRPKMSYTSSTFTVSYQDLPTPALTVHPQMSSTSASSTGSVQDLQQIGIWASVAAALFLAILGILLCIFIKTRGSQSNSVDSGQKKPGDQGPKQDQNLSGGNEGVGEGETDDVTYSSIDVQKKNRSQKVMRAEEAESNNVTYVQLNIKSKKRKAEEQKEPGTHAVYSELKLED
ncbi:low affinity immunoglobulin gamma Fc region receptor II-like [Denticeps clupeoides]|uniref:Ig-like domain-containing protein n=1 Tax=Denticeps clupeoides TaxID=299321 RepID=A0AAY3ZSZ8_9TELE|nr:low affinity immunoglobulin gamma Fc region receptor II-like [Denticeps clupeoides]